MFSPKLSYLLLDIGSSSFKVYAFIDQKLELVETKSFHFKQNLDENGELKLTTKNEFVKYLKDLRARFENYKIKTYCTAFFRSLSQNYKQNLIFEVFDSTGIFLNIISHDLENFYLQKALIGKIENLENTILVNIGGGSSEIIVIQSQEVLEKYNLEIGIGQLLEKFGKINEEFCPHDTLEIIEFIKSFLPKLKNIVKIAIYSGGELEFMRLCDYKIVPNQVFIDYKHPSQIRLVDFIDQNKKILSEISIQKLMNKMPKDPKWMLGARSCSLIAQAIFENYQIQIIIPSNSNLVDGIIVQEFQTATLSGSFRKHLDYINKIKVNLENQKVQILSPRFAIPKNPGEEFVVFEGEEGQTALKLEKHHLESIQKSDCLIVCNKEGYVGASALIEIGFAISLDKNIIFTEIPTEFMLNTLPHQIYE